MSVAVLRPAWQLPALARADAVLKAGLVLAVASLTFLDRFGLRVTADWALPASMAAVYALVALMLLVGAAQVDRLRAAAFVAVVGVAGASFLVNTWFEPRPQQSVSAWMLVVLSYAPFALRLGHADPRLWRWTARLFANAAALVAAAGIAQFFAQFFTDAGWLFDYTPLIPEALRTSGQWNTVNPVASWVQADGYWIKSNGFFLREASMFSVALAFGIVCELALGARRWAIALMGAGLVLSYSGSGLLCLAVALAFPLERRTVLRILALAAVAGVLALVLGDALNLSYTVNRIAEFGDERSSAYCRFIHPAVAFAQGLHTDAWSLALGHGPGSMSRAGATCVDLHQPTYGKLLFEYGLAGAMAFGALVLHALNRAVAPLRLRVALGVSWLFLGGNLVASEILAALFLFCAVWPSEARWQK
ncbi:MAG TPA: hypothetical protein VNU64_18410 [Burkholderiales bacterium]|nr:hypothetical protein [Burkholderiales bacterium]